MTTPRPQQPAFTALLTAAEVADILHVSLRTVRRLIASHALEAVRFGRSVRVQESVLRSFIDRSARR